MFLQNLKIKGFKNFSDEFEIHFNKGLNILIGENAVGKSAIIDSIRHLLVEDEFGRTGIKEDDFNHPFISNSIHSKKIQIISTFKDMDEEELVTFLPWSDLEGQALLTMQIENKENSTGRYKRLIWGGKSQSSAFEWELLDRINCIYLPPLRDAEAKLKEGKGSRLARLIKNINQNELDNLVDQGKTHPLVEEVKTFNTTLTAHATISSVNQLIKKSLQDAIGEIFGQDTLIQFSEVNFNDIVENLKLLFFPNLITSNVSTDFRNLSQNSLGYNNLLYLATILAEFSSPIPGPESLKLLLIEEPEAHLHPQLQTRLLKYLETKALETSIQIIVTTHSPVLASAVSIESIIHLTKVENKPFSLPLIECGIDENSINYLNRWLDTTKSTLLFAKGIILVEGIAEAMLIPELAKIFLHAYNLNNQENRLPESLEESGISIINIGGTYFSPFIQLFCNLQETENPKIPIYCSCVTDLDPSIDSKPTHKDPLIGNNPNLNIIEKVNGSEYCRIFISHLKTFEYDLGMEGNNLNLLIKAFLNILETDGDIRKEFINYRDVDWITAGEDQKKEVAYNLLHRINPRKGEFSQEVARLISIKEGSVEIPEYLKKAILWANGVSE